MKKVKVLSAVGTQEELEQQEKLQNEFWNEAKHITELSRSFGEKWGNCIANVNVSVLPNNLFVGFSIFLPAIREKSKCN
jgi:hypothetical protein